MQLMRNQVLLYLGKLANNTHQREIIGYLLFAHDFAKHFNNNSMVFTRIEIFDLRSFGEIVNGNIACVIQISLIDPNH
jgi:hypothetical protein